MSTSTGPIAMSKPRIITIFCWILGKSKSEFPVDIMDSLSVGHLKDKIVEKNPNVLSGVDASELTLWKVSIQLTRQLKNRVNEHQFLEDESLLTGDLLEDIFPPPHPLKQTLHIVVQRPTADLPGRSQFSPPTGNFNHSISPLTRSHPCEIDKLIDEFLSTCRSRMRQLVMSANDTASLLPFWTPNNSANAKLKGHVAELRIPAVRGRPALLLHNLGEERTELDAKRFSQIPDIFLNDGQHTILINTAGSGKTRLLLDGLCRHWGFYVAADDSEVGSEDFHRIVCDLTTYWDYERAKMMNKSGLKTQESVNHTQETASRALSQVLLSRFLLLGLLVEEVQAVEEQQRLTWFQYRRLWVLLQIQPVQIFGRDLFRDLARCLQPATRSELDMRIRVKFQELPSQLKEEPFHCVLDDAQATTDVRYRDFFSENISLTRPLLREIWRSWTNMFHPLEMSLILSGTGFKEDEITSTLSSNFLKPANYVIKRDIGAFDDPDDQAKYIRMYIPADWTASKWQEFLKRSWAWFRGRYRNTTTLVSLILEVGYENPHGTINSYVERFTAFRPTDADDWIKQEPVQPELPAINTLNFDRMSQTQATTLATALLDQVVYGTYSLQSFAAEDRATFVEYGFARTVTVTNYDATQTVLDEPIAILAALNWVNQIASLSLYEYLRQEVGKHSKVGSGFENYFAFYVRSFFEAPQQLAKLFKFRYDFDEIIDWKSEEFELVTVSQPQGSDQPHISIVTPDSGPSSNIGFRAAKGEDVLSWMSTNEGQFTFCFPPKHFGPDLLFFLRSKVSGKLLLVLVQCKNYFAVSLDDLITGVRTVTPDWLWKSKDTKHQTVAETRFPKGGPPNASDLAQKTMDALGDIPFGLALTNAQFPILRVFASWPADAKLDRSKPKPPKTNRKPAGNEGLPSKKKDDDSHPLATLHLENFVRMSNEMDVNWFRGRVEQNEVVHLKRAASEDLDMRKRVKQRGNDDMVL